MIELWNKDKARKNDEIIAIAQVPIKYGKEKIFLESKNKRIAYMYLNMKKKV